MSRLRGRRRDRFESGGEHFARIPRDALESEALKTAPHAAVHLLLVLLVGHAKERNGTLACSDSYAAKFGFNSRDTVYKSLRLLRDRGVIVVTRQGLRMRKIPTLYAVTWWPIYNRDGQPLDRPEPATYAYRMWQNFAPPTTVETEIHTDRRSDVTPMTGVEANRVHLDSHTHSRKSHHDYREYSKNLGAGAAVDRRDKVIKLMTTLPHLNDTEVAKITREPIEFVTAARLKVAS